MSANRSSSILAVDFGNVHTRAILIDLVDGIYYLVAQGEVQTTAGFPNGDVAIGLARVVEQISDATGRRMVTNDLRQVITPEQPDRSGVATLIFPASIGRPLRTVLMGLVPSISVASGRRSAAGTYIEIVDTFSLDDPRSEQDRFNALIAARPDLIFIVGGLVVLVAILAWVFWSGGAMTPAPEDTDVDISVEAPDLPDLPEPPANPLPDAPAPEPVPEPAAAE